MIFESQVARSPVVRSQVPQTHTLQRKCACGGTSGPTGECEQCKRKRLTLQRKLAINEPGDRYEQEADRVAEVVVGGSGSGRPSISSLGKSRSVQCDGPKPEEPKFNAEYKEKTEEEEYKEAAKKAGEAFLKTPPGREIEEKAKELGDALISTLPGVVITGTAIAEVVTALAVTHKDLPVGIPEIPLDKIKPGLKMKITYEGPVDKPTKVMATFSFSFGAGGKKREKIPKLTESEKRARKAAELRLERRTPEEKAAEARIASSRMLPPDKLTPRTSPLSFGVAGEELGFHPGTPSPAPRSSLGPWAVPDIKLTGQTEAEMPKREEEEGKTLQRKAATDHETGAAPGIVGEVLQAPGQLLDSATRVWMEDRFGHDFSQVRIHADARAAESARAVDAAAYTVGKNVVFAAGQFRPDSMTGRQLLAHELTHVVQQNAAPSNASIVQRAPANKKQATPRAAPGGDTLCKGSAAKHTGATIFRGKFPSALASDFGTIFDPIRRSLDSPESRELGFHFPVLNGKHLPTEAADIAKLIQGPERGSRKGVEIRAEGRRQHASFRPPEPNIASSDIVLPATEKSGTLWKLENVAPHEVANLLAAFAAEGKVPIDYRGTDEDCRRRTDSVNVAFSFEKPPEPIIEAHEKRHAEDWKKNFCQVVGRRDRRIKRRTGAGNARTGFALNDPAKAEKRALRKLYSGIESKLETAEALAEAVAASSQSLHRAGKLNLQNKGITVTAGCSAVVVNTGIQPALEEGSDDASDGKGVTFSPLKVRPAKGEQTGKTAGQNRAGTSDQVFRSSGGAEGKGQGAGPSSVSLSNGTQIVHTPPCGGQTVRATAAPPGLTGITWSLHDDGTKVDPGTSINQAGEITLANGQTGGTIRVRATDANGATADIQLILSSHPVDIDSTSAIGPPPDPKNNYGGTFDHVFKSNDGKVESLENVGVGERFPNVPTPDAATHALTGIPFGNGTFTLTTATLTPGATNNWFLTKAGGLNGTRDRVSMTRSGVDVGQHIISTSNPKPANPLPAGFSVQQDLHWYCPAAAADKRWTKFKSIDHIRRLRLDSGGEPEFVVIVNNTERTDAYTGTTGVQKATANSSSIVKSPDKGKANTVQITATALPGSRQLHFSLQGNALGCSINAKSGLLTIGKQSGSVTVRAADKSGGTNFDDVAVTIADPPATKPPAGGTPGSSPGAKTSSEGSPNESEIGPGSGESRGRYAGFVGLGQGPKEDEAPKKSAPPPKQQSKPGKALPTYKYKTGDLRAVPDWTYIAYLEQGKALLRFFSSAAKIEIGTIGWITNNPGNIDYAAPDDPKAGAAAKEAGKQGAYQKSPADTRYGRFAIFPSRATGVAAILPVLGKYVESNPDQTVEDAIKRYKGSEKDFSDFKLLFPNEPMPQTDAEKKTAAARVAQAYADALRRHMRDVLREKDKNLSEADIKARIERVMTHKFSELDQSSDDARLLRAGLVEKEGGLVTPGVEFSCAKGFISMNLLAYSEPQRKKILPLVSNEDAAAEMRAVLGCNEEKKP